MKIINHMMSDLVQILPFIEDEKIVTTISNTSTDNNPNLLSELTDLIPTNSLNIDTLTETATNYQETLFENVFKSKAVGFLMVYYGLKGNLSLIERGGLLALGSLNIYSNYMKK